ncbi:translation initiation protein [Haematococcus lacustris]
MSATEDLVVPVAAFDPLLDANGKEADGDAETGDYVHIRVQQRNGRKSLTTVQGLKQAYDYKKVLKALKKDFCCNGTVVDDPELGQVIQLQGDQRKNVQDFLLNEKLVKKNQIKIHGF